MNLRCRFLRPHAATSAKRQRLYRPVLESLEDRCLLSAGYVQTNLVSDLPGLARFIDSHLVNPWGISLAPTGPFWVSDADDGVSTLYDGTGQNSSLVVTIPGTRGSAGVPTGTVFNPGPGFVVSQNGRSGPGAFLFATEQGTIAGWSPQVSLLHAIVAVDNSSRGAVYTGLALATNPRGSFLYAANFGAGKIDVFDAAFWPVRRSGAFSDPSLPSGFAPFNVQEVGGHLFVTYAQKDPAGYAPRADKGFVNVFDANGTLLQHFASGGSLDAPWGVALAPTQFGEFSGDALIGNFGDGCIHAFDFSTGAFRGTLTDAAGVPITIPNLWALSFGNGAGGGDTDALYFTAGMDNEQHGLFGELRPIGAKSSGRAGTGQSSAYLPTDASGQTGSQEDDYPLPPPGGPMLRGEVGGGQGPTAVLLSRDGSPFAFVPTLLSAPNRGVGIFAASSSALVSGGPFGASQAALGSGIWLRSLQTERDDFRETPGMSPESFFADIPLVEEALADRGTAPSDTLRDRVTVVETANERAKPIPPNQLELLDQYWADNEDRATPPPERTVPLLAGTDAVPASSPRKDESVSSFLLLAGLLFAPGVWACWNQGSRDWSRLRLAAFSSGSLS